MNIERDESINVQEALEFAKNASKGPAIETKDDKSLNLDNYEHGDVVEVGGIPGIVIDREKKLRDIAENDDMLNTMRALTDPNDPTFSTVDPSVEKSEELDAVMARYLEEHPDAKMKRDEVKKAFSGYNMGWEIDERGIGRGVLVPENDPRAKAYAEAMRKLQTGEVVLPTVEEYEAQEKAAKERQMQMAQQHLEKHAVEQQPEVPQEQEESEEPKTSMEYRVEHEMEEMRMSAEEREKAIKSAPEDPMLAAIAAQNAVKEEPMTKKEEKVEEPVPAKEEAVLVKQEEPKQQPIDLFAAKEQLETSAQAPAPVKEEVVKQPEKPDVVINVPAEKAETFVSELKGRTDAEIKAARKIQVNFTKKLDLPKVSKRIVDIDGYRSVAPKNVSADITPRILINSGYIGYFKPCGALKWSRLAPAYNNETEEFEDMDQAKIIQFCYEQLATTSIGNLTYRQFLEQTSIEDVSAMLHAIMGASLPDEQEVMLTCGSCRADFETKYSIAELPDYDAMSEETSAQAQRIQEAKDIIEDAKDVHDESPVMQVCSYTADSTGTVFVVKHSDLTTTVDRQAVTRYLEERYGTSAALLSLVIVEVRINLAKNGEEPDWSQSNDPAVICEELLRLSSENLEELKSVIEQIPIIPSITYSFKGTRTCTNCGRELSQLSQNIPTLVFQIALRAQYFV